MNATTTSDAAGWRQAAEAKWSELAASRPVPSEAEARQRLHELEVRQIEWEMRNGEPRRQEAEIKTILRTTMDGFFLVDSAGRFLDVNDAYCQMSGYAREELLRMAIKDVEALETDEVIKKRIQHFKTDGHARFESQHRRKDGSLMDIEISGNFLEDGGGRLFVFMRDITARKQAEQTLKRLNRLYATLSQISQTVVRVTEPQELYAAVCRDAVESGQFRMAWIGTANAASGRLKVVSHAGPEEGYLEKIVITLTPAHPWGRGPTGLAMQRGEVFINNDTRRTPEMAPWREEALKRGYESSASVPFRCKGVTVGALTIYSSESGFFTADERNLLKQIGDSISFALEAMAGRTEREQAEQTLRESEERYRQLFELESDAVILVDCETHRYMDANPAALRLYGYPREEFLQLTPEQVSEEPEKTRATVGTGLVFVPIRWHRRKNGERFAVEIAASVIQHRGRRTELATLRDITNRQRAMEILQETTAQLLAAQRIARLGTYNFDVKNGDWSSCAVLDEIFGIVASGFERDVAGWLQIVHPQDRAEMARYLAVEIMQKKAAFDHVYRIVRQQDQQERWVHGLGKLTLDEYGQVARMSGIIQDITESKRAELALRESESKQRNILETIQVGILIIDPESHTIVEANPAAAAMIGETREQLVGSVCHRHICPAEKGKCPISDLKQTVDNSERMLLRRDGTRISIIKTVVPINWGGRQHLLESFVNITERKQAEQALASERVLLRTLVDHLPLSVYLKDTAGRKTLANAEDLKNFGLASEAELLGRTDFDFFPPEQAVAFHADDQRVLRTSQPVLQREEQVTRPDGSKHWILTSKVPLFDAAGQVTGLAGISLDITERKQAEEKLVRLATAVEQASEAILITDPEGTIVYANPAFERCTGYSPLEAIGQNPRVLKSGKHDAAFYQEMWHTLRSGRVWAGHLINKRKDGTLLEQEATISPVRNASGAIVNYVAVKRDVTREVELAEQLRQAQKMEAVGQLAGGVAHDFNNLLSSQFLQVSLLTMDPNLPAEVREGLEQIYKDAQRAANLVRQLLLFSRRKELCSRDLDLNAIVADLAKMLRRTIGEQLELRLNLAPGLPLVHADPGMMEQVLLNLAVNARDAMLAGGTLTIETTAANMDDSLRELFPEAVPGQYVRLRVSDTGTGIPPEILPHIFEPFFTTKEVGKGTGLGLATVFGIVKQHRGAIKVANQPGRGVAFEIFLPTVITPAGTASAVSAPAQNSHRGTETILLVEDEAGLRLPIQKMLTRHGYTVLEAADGLEAMGVWREHASAIHLLLTDLVMPGAMSGKELADQLLAEQAKLKVILMSGYSAEIAGRELNLRAGMLFMQKPMASDVLLATIRRCLEE